MYVVAGWFPRGGVLGAVAAVQGLFHRAASRHLLGGRIREVHHAMVVD